MKREDVHVAHPISTGARNGPASESGCGCGCGCGGRGDCCCDEPECCELECLERPRFFCGQLLTDQDLAALTDWAGARFDLSRHTTGWGVACGLGVTCAGGSRITVEPGHAVDCCGRDVVVCEPATVDLADACRRPEDPCSDLGFYLRDDHENQNGKDQRHVMVDLAIRHAETPGDAQTALAPGACGKVDVCQPTRVREGHELLWSEAEVGVHPGDAAWKRWLRAWERCCEVLERYEASFGSDFDVNEDSVRRWLLAWLEEHPPRQFCFLHDWVCRRDDDGPRLTALLPHILFFLVQDCRNALAATPCPSCEVGTGVPLARVCLESDEDGHCRVLAVDPYPPYRRPLGPDRLPAPRGQVNLAAALWLRPEEACRRLADLGVRVGGTTGESQKLPDSLDELWDLCNSPPLAACGEEVCLDTVDLEDQCLDGPRVVAFPSCPTGMEEEDIEVEVHKFGPAEHEASTREFFYQVHVRCDNPRSHPVTLTVVDALPDALGFSRMGAGGVEDPEVQEGRLEWQFEVPAGNRAFFKRWNFGVKPANGKWPDAVANLAAARVEGAAGTLATAESEAVETRFVWEAPVGDPTDYDPGWRHLAEDFGEISGIAEGRTKALHKAGVLTFRDLAGLSEARLKELIPTAGDQAREWLARAAELAEEK